MADSVAYSRIYTLQAEGVDKVIADINTVIARLEVLGQVKNKINSMEIADPELLAEVAKQYEALIATTERAAQSQQGLSDRLAQALELQKGVSMSMNESTVAMGTNLTSSTAALTKMQATLSEMARNSAHAKEGFVDIKDTVKEIVKALVQSGNAEEAMLKVATTLVSTAIFALLDKWTKISDEEEVAKERLEDYKNSMKDLQKMLLDMPASISAGATIDTENEKLWTDIMTDGTMEMGARIAAYEKLRAAMPGLFNGLTQ